MVAKVFLGSQICMLIYVCPGILLFCLVNYCTLYLCSLRRKKVLDRKIQFYFHTDDKICTFQNPKYRRKIKKRFVLTILSVFKFLDYMCHKKFGQIHSSVWDSQKDENNLIINWRLNSVRMSRTEGVFRFPPAPPVGPLCAFF